MTDNFIFLERPKKSMRIFGTLKDMNTINKNLNKPENSQTLFYLWETPLSM